MLVQFQKHIQENFSHLQDAPFLLAVSGGVDSVVLAHLFAQSDIPFALAHCNFRLRGEESTKDEKLVLKLANDLESFFHLTHFDTISYVNKNKVSVQVAARELRYHWFEQTIQEYGYKTLVTAHHADDDLETFLINLSRGTGLEGLNGIPAKTDTISRPLLAFSRAQILKYAEAEKLQWREDESNSDTKYLRNKIRHEVIPKLKELHPTFLENFGNTLANLKGSSSILQHHITALKAGLFNEKDGVVHISIEKLQKLNPLEAYLYEFFKDYGFTAWNDIKNLMSATSGKEVRSKTHRLLKDREDFLLQKLETSEDEVFFIAEDTQAIDYPLKIAIGEVDNYEKANNSNILYIDKKTLKYPLVLRKWKEGDYFYPLGMKGKKKVSKFFKDEKMDIISKERQWLLCSDDKIVWIPGKRADERFKVTEATKTIIKITLS